MGLTNDLLAILLWLGLFALANAPKQNTRKNKTK